MNRRKPSALALVLLCMLLTFLHMADYTLRPDDEGVRTRLEDFYAQPRDTLDVVFVGSSAVYTFFSPLRMYDRPDLRAIRDAEPVRADAPLYSGRGTAATAERSLCGRAPLHAGKPQGQPPYSFR